MSAQPEWNRTAESVENRLSNDNRPADWERVDEAPESLNVNHLLRPDQVAEWLNVSVEWYEIILRERCRDCRGFVWAVALVELDF